MKFVHWKDLFGSLQALMQLGGKFGKAAAQVTGVLRVAQRKDTIAEVFLGIPTTNHGESRIQHCVKYDLQGSCRLVTVQHNNICFLMFAGSHDACDAWLESKKGIRFHLKTIDGRDVIESTRASDDVHDSNKRLTTIPDFSNGQLWEKLPERHFEILTKDLPTDYIKRLKELTSAVMDEELFDLAFAVDQFGRTNLVYDVFDLLRGGFVQESKARIELHKGEVKPIESIGIKEILNIHSGDEVVMNDDVDPVLFEHFLKTASFQKWMVYLHPGQREYVKRDFSGPARLTGVSGSGKTAVLIHRAVRLAKEFPDEKVLVITLNRSLAKMIGDLTKTIAGNDLLDNLLVSSFWELCRDNLSILEPENSLIYWEKTVKTNPFAESEHIDDIWEEYFECKNNNDKAKVLTSLQRTLINRGIYPADYIRQEFDYIRSALGPFERSSYLKLEREGRSVPLEERYRENVVEGLAFWEEKMTGVGAIDYLGLATALYKHIGKLKPAFRSILIDEMQDFGCIELKIIRSLVKLDKNDIFMCGDFAQSVLTKYHKMSESGINIAGRSHSIRKNYRNSREILGAAFDLFENNRNLFLNAGNVEILNPEFANFSSSPPLLLQAKDSLSELSHAIGYLRVLLSEDVGRSHKFCIAICGYNQSEIELLGQKVDLEVLNGDTDVVAGQIFISDLEQTKGFEFDSMIILNCSSTTMPHPALPVEESYRDLCKLYVAMTRAKTELIVSYIDAPSSFLVKAISKFTSGEWDVYSEKIILPDGVNSMEQFSFSPKEKRKLTAKEILHLPEVVGLSTAAQEKMMQLVTGTNRYKNTRQTEWRSFDDFVDTIKSKQTLRSFNGISDGVWIEFERLNDRINPVLEQNPTNLSERRSILKLPRQLN
jgi:hypothetical protein